MVYVFQRAEPPVLAFAPSGALRGGLAEGRIADAHGIAITPDDRLLLVDRDAHQVLILTTDGEILATLGERHRPRPGAPFNHPTDAAVADDGESYVADGYGNSMVHRFSADGRHLQSFGGPGTGPGEFTTPHAVWVDRSNRVWSLIARTIGSSCSIATGTTSRSGATSTTRWTSTRTAPGGSMSAIRSRASASCRPQVG
jgi:sugar lactone lactonase YvrE